MTAVNVNSIGQYFLAMYSIRPVCSSQLRLWNVQNNNMELGCSDVWIVMNIFILIWDPCLVKSGVCIANKHYINAQNRPDSKINYKSDNKQISSGETSFILYISLRFNGYAFEEKYVIHYLIA